MHLTWKLSDDIVIALSFECHGLVLSEPVVSSLCFPLQVVFHVNIIKTFSFSLILHLYFRKMTSKEHIVIDLLQSDECVRVMFPPFRTKTLSIDRF